MKLLKKFKLNLTTAIFIALGAGALLGIALNLWIPKTEFVQNIIVDGVFYVLGNGFISLMKMLVVPLVFCSLVTGASAMGDGKALGSVGLKTVLFYLLTTSLAVFAAIVVANIINPGAGLSLTAGANATVETGQESMNVWDTILNIIPTNPVESLAKGDMLQLIVFALIVGVIIAKMGDRVETVKNIFIEFNDIMMEMTNMVMKLAPIGVFCMIARTFSGIGFDAILPLLKYVLTVITGLVVQVILVYMPLLSVIGHLNPFTFLKKFFPVMAFAFSTSTSNATIPLNIETLEDKMGVSRKIASFTIPLGATVNMDGTSIMQGVAVVFAAQAYGIVLTPAQYLTVIATATLASIGTAGIPSVGLVTLSMVFTSVGLPTDAIMLIMGIDRILDMMRTAVNVTGDAVCTAIVAKQAGSLDLEVYNDPKAGIVDIDL